MFAYLLIFLSFCSSSLAGKAPYQPCKNIPQIAQILEIIPHNNSNETTWLAKSESKMKADIIFTVTKDVKRPELLVVALLDPTGGPGGKELELVYGRPEDGCKLINSTSCKEEGLKPGKIYKLKANFETPAALPKISLHVRFILRQSAEKKLTRTQKVNWRRYPGEMIICTLWPVTVI